MTTTTELKKVLFSMILKTPIWLVHLAANQSSVNEHTYTYTQTPTHIHMHKCSGVSRISFRGGFKSCYWKSGVFAWHKAPCSTWQSHAFARGVRGHAPRENFKKWCNMLYVQYLMYISH